MADQELSDLDAASRAAVLAEALPYIQAFADKVVVIKFGGNAMVDDSLSRSFAADIVLLRAIGLRPVVVHGGGKAITKRMAEKGVKASFVKGLRVTDEQSMDVVEQVLNREVNVDLVQILEKAGCTARGIHGEDILRVYKHTERDEWIADVVIKGRAKDAKDTTDVRLGIVLVGMSEHP